MLICREISASLPLGLIVLREDQLVEGDEGTGRRFDDGVDFGFGEFHAEAPERLKEACRGACP